MGEAESIWVDAAFPLTGKSLPLDHGYPLFSAISRIVPSLHENASWGIHPVLGNRAGPGLLSLFERSWLKIRLPANCLAEILPLAGQSLEVAGHAITAGMPRLYPLQPAPALKARFVTVKKFHEEESPFADALRRQLAAIDGLGQDPERIELAIGPRRVVRIAEHTVVGFAVALEGLEADASLAVQRVGLGGRRHMGSGIFVPQVPRR